jgi:hypothetical protein
MEDFKTELGQPERFSSPTVAGAADQGQVGNTACIGSTTPKWINPWQKTQRVFRIAPGVPLMVCGKVLKQSGHVIVTNSVPAVSWPFRCIQIGSGVSRHCRSTDSTLSITFNKAATPWPFS